MVLIMGVVKLTIETIDELYITETIDGILLSRDWKDIKEFYCMEFEE